VDAYEEVGIDRRNDQASSVQLAAFSVEVGAIFDVD
jgi:hypothetical protein